MVFDKRKKVYAKITASIDNLRYKKQITLNNGNTTKPQIDFRYKTKVKEKGSTAKLVSIMWCLWNNKQ